MKGRVALAGVAALCLATGPAHAQPPGGQAHAQNPAGQVTAARELLEQRRPEEAIPLLKQAIEREPYAKHPRLLLARAYLDDGNLFWALRTLAAAAELHPGDCSLRLWQAWVHIGMGSGDAARELLRGACAAWEPERARAELLWALLERQAGANDRARSRLDRARARRMAFAEDRAAMAELSRQLDPGYVPPLSGRVDVGVGWTANARAGSPTDPVDGGRSDASPMGQVAAWLRFVAPTGAWWRPAVEAEARAIGFSADAGHDLSYLMLGGRPGLLLGAAGRQLLVAYRHEALLLAADDRYAAGPLWFYGAHRGELELELGPALTLFGGVGQRDFRELGRSRLEVDGGIGTGLDAGRRVRLVGALSGRFHDARKSAYDLRGGSLLLLAEVSLLRGWSMRAGALASADHYPRSGGYFDRATDSARRDLLLKLSASGFSPRLAGQLKLGLTYEFARRDSTAAPYDYQDHRVLAKLVWSFTGDPWLPAAVSPADHVALDHGLRAGELQERVQDLLRQDEAAQRSSSCLD